MNCRAGSISEACPPFQCMVDGPECKKRPPEKDVPAPPPRTGLARLDTHIGLLYILRRLGGAGSASGDPGARYARRKRREFISRRAGRPALSGILDAHPTCRSFSASLAGRSSKGAALCRAAKILFLGSFRLSTACSRPGGSHLADDPLCPSVVLSDRRDCRVNVEERWFPRTEGGEADSESLCFARHSCRTKPKEVMTKPAHLSST